MSLKNNNKKYNNMSHISLLSTLFLTFLILTNGSFILVQGASVNLPCNLTSITADQPSFTYTFEAGVSEFWNQFTSQFVCTNVDAVRNTILPRGLLLPHYTDAPQFIYILKGEGVQGTVFPGCPNEYDSKMDQYQRVRKFKEGDVLALPAGITLWFYNTGDVPVVTLSIFNFRSPVDQLDSMFRIFFLAGNYPIGEGNSSAQAPGEGGFGNIFSSFDQYLLAESFNVTPQLASQLKGAFDHRGRIVLADLMIEIDDVIEQKEQPNDNVMIEKLRRNLVEQEDSRCTMKLGVNLIAEDPDWYNPWAGRINSVNSQKIPHLDLIQLSAERVILFKNATLAPHWNVNAHSIMYIISGSIRIQLDDRTGKLLFNGEVQEGQIIIVPEDTVILTKAGELGCEFIAFKTNSNPEINTLAGRVSTIKGIPVEVLMSSYNISRDDANRLKHNRKETILFSPVMI